MRDRFHKVKVGRRIRKEEEYRRISGKNGLTEGGWRKKRS